MLAYVRGTIPATPVLATHSEDPRRWGGARAFAGAGAQLVETEEETDSVCCPRGGASAHTAPGTVLRAVGKGSAAGLEGGVEGGAGGVKGAFVQARV